MAAPAKAAHEDLHADRKARVVGLGVGPSRGKQRANRHDDAKQYSHKNFLRQSPRRQVWRNRYNTNSVRRNCSPTGTRIRGSTHFQVDREARSRLPLAGTQGWPPSSTKVETIRRWFLLRKTPTKGLILPPTMPAWDRRSSQDKTAIQTTRAKRKRTFALGHPRATPLRMRRRCARRFDGVCHA